MRKSTVTFRVYEREREQIEGLAEAEGLSVSDLIRHRLGLPIRAEAKELPAVEGSPDPSTEPGAAALRDLRRRLGQN